jgi:hypothetical protein
MHPPAGRAWEMTRYLAYQAHLAGHTTGEVFVRYAAFLQLAAVNRPSITRCERAYGTLSADPMSAIASRPKSLGHRTWWLKTVSEQAAWSAIAAVGQARNAANGRGQSGPWLGAMDTEGSDDCKRYPAGTQAGKLNGKPRAVLSSPRHAPGTGGNLVGHEPR